MMTTDEVPKASLVVNADAIAITDIAQRFQRFRSYQYFPRDPVASGRLTRMVGLTLEARGVNAAVGHSCLVISRDGLEIETEVVGFHNDTTYLMPIQGVVGLQPGARVRPMDRRSNMVMGEHLCGRVLDGIGKPLDALGPLQSLTRDEFKIKQINPLHRHPIEEPLDVGIRAINALLTVGKGQRIGLFAGSGVGKSVLLGMMTRYTSADVVVVGLIGERGREVKEFIDLTLGADGLTKSVVVASPADDAPLMRLRAAQLATRIAEYFRDQGKDVLLLMDSLTRYGQAQREIALSIGEPPATKGYPPSVFSKIPALVERAGNGEKGGGSITAIYTVLTEGDDLHDPIADAARAILDGHIVLSRRLAEEGVYPAIDIEASVSRVMPNIVSDQHLQDAQKFKRLMGLYHGNKDLISIGAYVKGSDPGIDEAIERYPALTRFIGQKVSVGSVYEKSIKELSGILHQSENDTPQKHLSSPLQTQNAGGNTKDANEKGINVSNSLQKGY